VGAARRHAAQLSQQAGFDDVAAGRVALVVTELGTNLLKHARNGRLLLALRQHGALREVEVLSLDEGPGIPNVARSLADGFSTSGTPGTGLGAVRRLADDFDLYSAAPGGSLLLARVRAQRGTLAQGVFAIGAVAVAAPGETVCGDGWVAMLHGQQASLMVADGLGHGPHAAEAAAVAIASFERSSPGNLRAALESLHGALRMTRGAAVFTARADAAAGRIAYAGAGNIAGRVVSGVHDRSMASQHGTAGLQLHRPEEMHIDWPAHAAFLLHSDGIQTRWRAEAAAPLLGHDPALLAAMLVRDYLRGRDDATAVVLRRRG
jgi:anti-sigma regulatory factor (Ser/Thr protein kinase)